MDADRARELIAAERERIARALAALGHKDDGEEADEFDEANRATDLYQDEFNEGLADDLREQLAGVERAEERLAAGTYGLSIQSGEPIPDARLEIVADSGHAVHREQPLALRRLLTAFFS